jgi:hypothetical protein
MKRVAILAGCLLAACWTAAQDPEETALPDGWTEAEQELRFVGNDLYGHINGGAEIYHEFGFRDLEVRRFSNETREISLEEYRMDGPEAALGIYLMTTGEETPVEGVSARNSGSPYQISAVRGKYLLQVLNPSGDKSIVGDMVRILNGAIRRIPDKEPEDFFVHLPKGGLVPGSEKLIRGPLALQPIFTFGEGDILRLRGRIYGVAGDYELGEGNRIHRIVVPYPSEEQARKALDHLTAHLDSYLRVRRTWETGFVFSDYRSRFGLVELKGNVLDLTTDLLTEPESPHAD